MPRLLLVLASIFLAAPAFADNGVAMHAGFWECNISGEDGTGRLVLDSGEKLLRMKLPVSSEVFSFPYEVLKRSGDSVVLSLAAPDKQSHLVELDLLDANRMTVEFLNEKGIPTLKCGRVESRLPIGH